MTRTVLIHLNVTVPDGDDRNADEVADAVLAAIEVGSDNDDDPVLREIFARGVGALASGNDSPLTCTLVEEV